MISVRGLAGNHDAPDPVVYVVDDDRSMRRSLRRLLKVSGWQVRSFDSAEAFATELDQLSSGFLIVDIQLPGMSGLELLERLQEMRVPCPAIAISGSNDASIEAEALRLGAKMFLYKPFDPQVLLGALEHMILPSDLKPMRFSGQ